MTERYKTVEPYTDHLNSPFNACQHRYECRALAREIERLTTEARIAGERFDLAQKCINQIDDLLEYSYKNYDVERLRDRIMGFIDDYGVLVSGSQKPCEHEFLEGVAGTFCTKCRASPEDLDEKGLNQ